MSVLARSKVETLAVKVSYESLDGSLAPVNIDGRELRVAVALAS